MLVQEEQFKIQDEKQQSEKQMVEILQE